MRSSITKLYFVLGVLVILLGAAAGPLTVFAEGVPLASPTPFPPERITAPEIFGLNPEVVLSEGIQGVTHPSGSFSINDLQVQLPIEPPELIELIPLETQTTNLNGIDLRVPLRTQEVGDRTCGLAALGMAMDFIELLSDQKAPTHQELVSFLTRQDLFYEWGTGVQELAFAARSFGYRGSYAFSNWTMEQLQENLIKKQPVVVSLGTNGKDKPGHFVTVTGISDDGKFILSNDPLKGKVTIPREDFITQWNLQANTGVIVQKKQLSPADDPFLPWMGLFSALSMLALIKNKSKDVDQLYSIFQFRLANPKRMGSGGGGPLPPEEPGILTVKEQKYEYKTVYRGLKTIKVEVPVFQTHRVQVGVRGIKKKIAQYEVKQVQVGYDIITNRVPEYTRKQIIVGTREVKKTIPVSRIRLKTVMEWKKIIKKVPVYRRIGSRRRLVGSRTQTSWKKVPVSKRIPYRSTKTITLQKPVYKDIRVLRGYRTETQKIPRYQDKKVLVGYKTVTTTEPVYEERKTQVGTKIVTRQVPDYQTVKIPIIVDSPPIEKGGIEGGQDDYDDFIAENPESKVVISHKEGDKGFHRKFEVTDVVYLKGGPGSKSYGRKAEEGYSSHSYGGESLPIMRGIGLLNNILVWIRDNTDIIKRMGGKPDAEALIFYTNQGSSKLIEEIRIKNLGNEIISIKQIKFTILTDENERMTENVEEIFPYKDFCTGDGDSIKIKPDSLSPPIQFSPLDIRHNITADLWIWLESESKRFGQIEYKISGVSREKEK